MAWSIPVLAVALALTAPDDGSAERIPYFARRYNVACTQCHVLPPKLNAFGEAFLANGYNLPDFESRKTWPFAVWVSGRTDLPAFDPGTRDRLTEYLNRVEVISGGPIVAPWLSYFVEWRTLSLSPRSDFSLKDRSGRFEDLFLTLSADKLQVFVGQFRQVQQVDVSRRLSLSEPLLLSSSLTGDGGDTPRQQSLRGFSPAGRSPAIRAGWVQPLGDGWRWTTAAAVPFPGELSIPLTDEARTEASNELALNPKGVVVESFLRRGLTSVGAHVFYDNAGRYLANALTTGNYADFYWTGTVGIAKSAGNLRGRWSAETEYIPIPFIGGGARVEDEFEDGRSATFVPYLNAHFPGTRYTLRLTLEHRFQAGRNATLLELGTLF
ncbi:MAG: hypothetical protein O7E49_04720 [Gemmatimonadetes bacterium]|nr:hypothetical protein [Gemmatimonadota bacterium]